MVENLLLIRSRQLLLDTNAFIYFLTGREPYFPLLLPLFQRVQEGELALIVSAVTESELLVRPYRDGDADTIERISDLLSEDGIQVLTVNRRIGRRAAMLRAIHAFRLPDAIIVATAIETGCDAVVGNDGKWRRLSEIPFVYLEEAVAAQGHSSGAEPAGGSS